MPEVPTKASLRKLLAKVLPARGQLEALCIDYFSDVANRLEGAISRDDKENLLLQMREPAEILEKLREKHPEETAKHEHLLKWESTAQIPTAGSITNSATFHLPPPDAVPAAATTGPVVATFDPAYPYFSVLYGAKGDQVIGRADALLMVREQLEKGRRTAIGQTAAFVGLGGLGKTQLAVEYAHAYKDSYPGGVYWFNADEDLDGQLTRLAVAARWVSEASEPRHKLEIARHQIRNRSNCLIVFDNVEDRAAIEALLPESSATLHLLITSRVSHVGFDPVPINRLPEEQSLELLQLESRRSLEKPDDREAALRIARQLEGLPLALELAGAYLRHSRGVSWTSYADLLEREGIKARGLGNGPLASFTRHNADLYATLRIDESLFEDSPLLREALDLLAWSGSASMGRNLLTVLLDHDEGGAAALDVALGEAETLRILKRGQGPTDPVNPRFHMHRLVREVRRAEVPLELGPARWLIVLERLGNWFEERREDFSHLSSYEAELDHLEAWQAHAARLGHAREAARLMWLRAYPYYHQGQFQRAHDLVESAFALFKSTAVQDLEFEARLLDDLGNTLSRLGDARKAIELNQNALDIRRQILGERHHDTASSFDSVGIALGELGEHRKALEYHQKALDIRREVLGEKHSDTATSLNNVGSALSNLGNHHNAFEHQQKALDISRKIYGEKHPATAIALNNLGVTLGFTGDHPKALDYKQKSLDIGREILGEKHPDTATWINNVGSTLKDLGNYRGAMINAQRALDIRHDVLGENHPDTATSHHNVAIILSGQGKFVDAFNHMKMALTIRQETLGDRHPHTIKTWENIVALLLQYRKKPDALALIENDLKKFPHNTTLRRLKNQILGKQSTQAPGRASGSAKRPKRPKR